MTPGRTPGARPPSLSRRLLLGLAGLCLLAGVTGGLQRLGVVLRIDGAGLAASHGALMVCGFLGTVITLERAIAWGGRGALAAPLASALGVAFALAGLAAPAALLLIAAPALLCVLCVGIVRRQRAVHNVALLAGALAWLAGNAALVTGAMPDAVAAWWFTFIVLTVAAERLELGRLRPRRAAVLPAFVACAALLVVGAACITTDPALRWPFAAGLLAIAAWLAAFDVAWRTIRAPGYARYAACALLAGYAWLAAAAGAWAAPPALGLRDLALHALGLGFAFSMIFAHAPVIVPVVARVRLRFSAAFYVPLVALHASLAWRVVAGLHDIAQRRTGAWLNAAALVLFAVTVVLVVARSGEGRRADVQSVRRGAATPHD